MRRLASLGISAWVCLLSVLGVASALAWSWFDSVPPEVVANPTYVGRDTCAKCHQLQMQAWLGSDHERAMDVATESSVLGDFNNATFDYQGVTTRFFRRDDKFMVNTEGPD